MGDGARARQLCRLQRVERDALPAASAAPASAGARREGLGRPGLIRWVLLAQPGGWMDVSGPRGGAGSSPAPWIAGRLARPWDLIHACLHTLQSKRGEKTCPCFPLGSQPQIQPKVRPQIQPKVQPQMQRGREGTAPTLNTHPAPCPVADKPYTSQHPPGSVPHLPAPQGTVLPLAKGPRGWIKCKISLWTCLEGKCGCVGVGTQPSTSQSKAHHQPARGTVCPRQRDSCCSSSHRHLLLLFLSPRDH